MRLRQMYGKSAHTSDSSTGRYKMPNRDIISAYIMQMWNKCANAKTVELTEEYSDKIDILYDILAEVSNYERSLVATPSVD